MKKFRNIIVCLMAVSMVLSAAGCNSKDSGKRKKKATDTEETQTIATDETTETTINIHVDETTETSGENTVVTNEETTEETSEGITVDEDGNADLGFTQGLVYIDNIDLAFTKTTPDMIDVTGGYKSTPDYQGEDDEDGSNDRLLGESYFDSNGNKVLFIRYDKDGDVVRTEYKIYDEQGRLIKEENWSRDSYHDSGFRVFEYNDDGSIALWYAGKASGYITDTNVFEYDEQGRLISELDTLTESGYPNFKYEYAYNDDGSFNKYYLGWLSSDNEFKNSAEQYKLYNADGLLIEDYTGTLSNEYTYYSYDEYGRLIGDEDYRGKKFNGNSVYTYDEEGRLIQKDRYFSSGNLNYSIIYNIEEM